MGTDSLHDAVKQFATLLHDRPDGDLDRPWAWQSYDFEGVRFAFFRTAEELKALALALSSVRAKTGQPITPAQRILAHYHAAYRDLEVMLLGLSDADAEVRPAADEWSVRDAVSHIVQAEIGFYVVCRHSLTQFRQGIAAPAAATKSERQHLSGLSEAEYARLLEAPLSVLQGYHARHQNNVLETFADMGPDELAVPSIFWEHEAHSLQFRLFRFDSHLRQHTVQIAKTLVAIDRSPAESQRLLHLVYAALAEAESAVVGCDGLATAMAGEMTAEVTAIIVQRTVELSAILEG